MSTYDLDPAIIAAIDQDMAAVSADLDVLLESYRVHRGNTDSTVAYAVLADNATDVLTLEQACKTLALAVHRLAELAVASAGETKTSSEEDRDA